MPEKHTVKQNKISFYKRILSLFLLAAFVCINTGCSSIGLDTRTLLAPPKANEDQQEIHKLMQGDEAEITFVFPKNGDYRSAITTYDFTGDGIEDAIGFYMLKSGGTEVLFMSKVGGTWTTISKFKNAASQVDRICFGDVTGDGIDNVLIGWGNTQNSMSASLSIFTYSDNNVNELQLQSNYGALTLTDYDNDDVKEIFILQRPVQEQEDGTEGIPANAMLFTIEGEMIVKQFGIEADSSIVRYPNILFGKVTTDLNAVVVDGAKADGSMTTQIFYRDKNGLYDSVQTDVNKENTAKNFLRPSTALFLSQDIDNDGLIEIPSPSLLPAFPESSTPDSTSYTIAWVALKDNPNETKVSTTTLMNSAEGYYFRVTGALNGKITSISDSKNRSVTYYSVIDPKDGSGEMLMGTALFSIRVFSDTSWAQRGEAVGYVKITQRNNSVYSILIHTDDPKYMTSIGNVVKDFHLTGN